MPKPTILICDDEENVRAAIRLVLEREYELVFAADGEEALQQVKAQPVDLILLDIKLPKVDGLEVLRVVHGAVRRVPLRRQGVLNRGELGLQIRQVTLDNVPDPRDVDAEVVVDEHVPQPDDALPVHFRMGRHQRLGELEDGLSECLQVAEHPVLNERRGQEGGVPLVGVLRNAREALLDVLQVDRVLLHSGTASRSTPSLSGAEKTGGVPPRSD